MSEKKDKKKKKESLVSKLKKSTTKYPDLPNYKVGKKLGEGSFATVREATSKKNPKKKYALKIIDKERLKDQFSARKLLDTELAILKQVDHPNCISLKKYKETEEKIVKGGELFAKIVKLNYYNEKEAVHIVRQVLEALAYLHSNGIVHRDLKPENILLRHEDSNDVCISDFGLGKIVSPEIEMQTQCGTPEYVAPEVLTYNQAPYTEACDLWAVGVITFVLLCGYLPFSASNQVDLFQYIRDADYDFDDDTWEQVSNRAKGFIQSLLVVDPQQRLTAEQALQHPWINKKPSEQRLEIQTSLRKLQESMDKERTPPSKPSPNDDTESEDSESDEISALNAQWGAK